MPLKNKFIPAFIILIFAAVFSLISLVNHYYLRTYAYDLGLFNNEAYSYCHFKFNTAPLMLPYRTFQNFLSDHFSLYAIFIGQFYRFFGSPTFLIFQIVAILFGGFGFYRWTQLKFPGNILISNIALIYFFSFWGIYSALTFDYHDNVTAAMLVPWLFYFFELRKFRYVYLFTILILISKENMALWAFFIFFGLAIISIRDRKLFVTSLFLSVLSISYFLLVVKIIIPSMNTASDKGYFHFNYSVLGKDMNDVVVTIIRKPVYFLSLLFKNPLLDSTYDHVKLFLHLFVMLSGGVFLILRPQFLIMLFPIYLQKMYNDDPVKWGLAAHYNIEFVPVIAFSAFSYLSKVKSLRIQNTFAIAITLSTLISTCFILNGAGNPNFGWEKERSQFFSVEHYRRDFNVKQVYSDLKEIPNDAAVSVSSSLAPHLAYREDIYYFPYLANADYIAILFDGSTYPLNAEDFGRKVEELKLSGDWEKVREGNSLLILKRRKLSSN